MDAPDNGTQKMTVLVIDDSMLVQARLKQMIRQLGFDVAGVAATGAEGVAQAIALQPGLILLDHQLPDAYGDEVARKLRDAEVAAQIIAITGTITPELTEGFLEIGVEQVLSKPVEASQLEAAVAACGFAVSKSAST